MDDQLPEAITERIEEIVQDVVDAYAVPPDLTPETLPLLDQLLRDRVGALPQERRLQKLIAVGAYFGEVMRRKLDGRWCLGSSASSWRIELRACFLHFRPVGIAAEALAGCEIEAFDGSLTPLAELHDALHEMLSNAAPLAEDEYYSLAGRADILELVADWLLSRRLASDEEKPLRAYSADDYAARIDLPHGDLPGA